MPPTPQLITRCHATVTDRGGIDYALFRGGTQNSTTHTLTACGGQAHLPDGDIS